MTPGAWPPAALPIDVELSDVAGVYANREAFDESAWDMGDEAEERRDLERDASLDVNR